VYAQGAFSLVKLAVFAFKNRLSARCQWVFHLVTRQKKEAGPFRGKGGGGNAEAPRPGERRKWGTASFKSGITRR